MVVFRPTMPQRLAGMRTEPPVSLPSAAGARPAATATPEPLLDPDACKNYASSRAKDLDDRLAKEAAAQPNPKP